LFANKFKGQGYYEGIWTCKAQLVNRRWAVARNEKDGWTTWRKMWTLFLRKKRNNKAWYISKTYCSSLQSDLTSFICNIVVVLLLLALLYPHNDLMDEAVSCLISAAGKMNAWNGANGCME
jgi:hypothetical protein